MNYRNCLKILCSISVVCLCCTCMGCSKTKSTGSTSITLNEVAHSVFYAPQYAAIELGYFKEEGIDAVILTHNIDQPFVTHLEGKNENLKFQRIDADLSDSFKEETSEDELKELTETLSDVFKKALNNDKLNIKVEKLKNASISSMITLSEQDRRMQDMMKMYNMYGMDPSMFGGQETLVLNVSHPLVKYLAENQKSAHAEMICQQLYDLAMISHQPLQADKMTEFINRSNEIMMLLTK